MTEQNQQRHLALIVDDEPDICELLQLTLNRMDIDAVIAMDLRTARQYLRTQHIAICLTDMKLPDGNGLELVKLIARDYAHIPVAMISAHGNMDTAIQALKSGAFDFVSKPVVLSELRNLINAAIRLVEQQTAISVQSLAHSAAPNNTGSRQQHTDRDTFTAEYTLSNTSETLPCEQKLRTQLLGKSPQIQKIRNLIIKLSKSQAPVMISGRSGTGKELAARQIHLCGPRSKQPFVPVNCGAIPAELMESEFFGHKKGSFSGAIKDKPGLFRVADGGTLFLDEVADLPLNMQVKLLRAIQEKAVKPVGDEKEHAVDVRIISATHKDLKQMVAQESFREDLFYRINVIELHMPSLVSRKEDIEVLAQYYLRKLAAGNDPIQITQNALAALKQYDFPGNIRELENILERALTLCENNTIALADLHLPQDTLQISNVADYSNIKKDKSVHQSLPAKDDTQVNMTGQQQLTNPVFENHLPDRVQLLDALQQTRWNRKAAARLLGITYRQLRYRLEKLDLE